MAKLNYHIHTDAVKEKLIPERIHYNSRKNSFIYANEADLLNLALFGKTAKDWKTQNPDKKGNMRDYASAEQLLVLTNLESHNAQFIKEGLSAIERLVKLNEIAIYQVQILVNHSVSQRLLNDKTSRKHISE